MITRRRWPGLLLATLSGLVIGSGATLTTLAASGQFDTTTTTTPGQPEPTSAPDPAEDPYEVYLRIAPPDAVDLTREDAQARALLGCGMAWAPGTVDAALAEAYAALCDQLDP
jgi:hypothetical protein